jgi:hypothetical protein
VVSSLARAGRSKDASGRVKSSIMADGSMVSLKLGEGCMRISEAGVAGVAPCPLTCAIIAGDWVTEMGFGGGRISDSMGSGEMESVSEVFRLCATSKPLRPPVVSSIKSLTSLGGMSVETVAFRRPGFTMGDCRIRVLAFADRGALLLFVLLSLRPVSCCVTAASISTSMGEWPVELPEVVC